jgi:hypothetical protein
MHDMARLFVANGYGFGKYWAGHVFAKTVKDAHFLYLAEDRMAILSSGVDEDGEKEILAAAEHFTPEELSRYFRLDYHRISNIDWFQPVNVLLRCQKEASVRDSLIYYTWPAVKLDFTTGLAENTIVVYDRFTPEESLEALRNESVAKNLSEYVEFWSMVKLLAMGDRFGELAPKVCMETALQKKHG